jgi:6-phosphogluconolactonase
MSAQWHVYPGPQQTAEACCRHVLSVLEAALEGEGDVSFAVSGGSTPAILFSLLAKTKFRWDRVHLFWVDERAVPPGDPQSNYRLAEEHLVLPAHIPHRNVHRIRAEHRPDAAARMYADEIRDFFRLAPGELPHFDLIHRGLGADAHTASLFPGDPLIEDRERIAAATFIESLQQWRVTMLPGVFLAARHTAILTTGADKAEAVRAVFQEPYDPMKYPAQVATHHARRIVWFLDEAAAASIR